MSKKGWLIVPLTLLAGSTFVYFRNGRENAVDFLDATLGALLATNAKRYWYYL